jgi:hypothetical protein
LYIVGIIYYPAPIKKNSLNPDSDAAPETAIHVLPLYTFNAGAVELVESIHRVPALGKEGDDETYSIFGSYVVEALN